jgi:hypothetical protein
MYRSFFRLIHGALGAARRGRTGPGTEVAAWAVIGLGTVATIIDELGLLSRPKRGELIRQAGRVLIRGAGSVT